MDITSIGSVNLIQVGTLPKGSKSTPPSEPTKVKQPEQEVKAFRKPEPETLAGNKAVFALQDNNHVVIQILNKDGEVVKQIPPKELVEAYKRLQEIIESKYDSEA